MSVMRGQILNLSQALKDAKKNLSEAEEMLVEKIRGKSDPP